MEDTLIQPPAAGYEITFEQAAAHLAAWAAKHEDAAAPAERPGDAGAHVRITVTCDTGHVIGTWTDTIEEKYPFYCEECDSVDWDADKRTGKYPWKLTTEIISA